MSLFIANFLNYKAITPNYIWPKSLYSSNYIIKQREGNSLNFSILLCSLLRGNHIDSYVVLGYAPEWIVKKDLSSINCPDYYLLEKDQIIGEKKIDKENDINKSITNTTNIKKKEKYQLYQAPELKSSYVEWLKNQQDIQIDKNLIKKSIEKKKKKIKMII